MICENSNADNSFDSVRKKPISRRIRSIYENSNDKRTKS